MRHRAKKDEYLREENRPRLWRRLVRIPQQIRQKSPFSGTIIPTRIPLFSLRSRPSLPFPHPWNYRSPIRILETFFAYPEENEGSGLHNRYLDVPGFAPVLITRDPSVIRAISTETGHKPGQFDRDTLPSTGIARATGADTLLYANGEMWKRQKKLSTPPFARTSLFQPERFHEFEETFRATVAQRLERVRSLISESGGPLEVQLEIEIKAIMLEMLVNNFFGASVAYEDIRERYVPALDRVIDHIVLDTVINKFGFPLHRLPSVVPFVEKARRAQEEFEHLTEIVLSVRQEEKGLWGQFKSDASDEALKSNIRVFLAGALEATTSYASWAIAHLARNAEAQDRCYEDVRSIHTYTPDALANAGYLGHVLNETLRLTPSLYFHPRRATRETTITTSSGETLTVPEGTHILLDVWHANRHEDHWGVSLTGYPASAFAPERWETISKSERASRDMLHFGFGHGPRFCPGKNLGQLEVALVVGACVKLFRFEAVGGALRAKAGVSTKPEDGTLVRLSLRSSEDVPGSLRHDPPLGTPPPDQQSGCPYSHS